jgi:hypothetical protein
MRPVALDPELIAAGILGDQHCRSFLGLLAYGRWAQYPGLTGPAEEAELRNQLRQHGGGRHGAPPEELRDAALDRRSAMADRLAYGAPDDLVLVSSRELHAAVVEEVAESRKWRPSATAQPELPLRAAAITSALTCILVPPADDVPRGSVREELVRVAAVASAPLVTEAEELAPNENMIFEVTDIPSGRPAVSIRWWTFVNENVNRYPFDLRDVPPDLLDAGLR